MKEIRLTQGKVALVNNGDFARVSAHRWFASKQPHGNQWYAKTNMIVNGRGTVITMHRFIMGLPRKQLDHRNGNGLDNRRRNLRFATHSQNGANAPKRKRTTSRFKGVNFDNWSGRWLARICVDRKQINLGRFFSEEAAGRAYEVAAKKHFGEFARF